MGEDAAQVNSIAFFYSYFEAASMLEDSQRLRFYDAIAEYAFAGVVPDFSDDLPLRLAWTLVLPNIQSSIKSRQNGRRGGRPRKEQEERE
jgi:hypothetical protein